MGEWSETGSRAGLVLQVGLEPVNYQQERDPLHTGPSSDERDGARHSTRSRGTARLSATVFEGTCRVGML